MSSTAESTDQLQSYAQPRLGRSLLDLATSVVPYLRADRAHVRDLGRLDLAHARSVAADRRLPAADVHRLPRLRARLVLRPASAPTAGSGRLTALLVWQPYENWRFDHAVHHGTAGDLDRRGQGDVPTWTVEEYYARPWQQRLGYRLFRNPLVMFGIGPIFSLMVAPRFSSRDKRRRLRNSIILTNISLAIAITGALPAVRDPGVPAGAAGARLPRRDGRASGSSTSSTSSRTSTGSRASAGATPTPRSRAARI